MKLFKSAVLFLVLIPVSILAASCNENASSANNTDSEASNNSNNWGDGLGSKFCTTD